MPSTTSRATGPLRSSTGSRASSTISRFGARAMPETRTARSRRTRAPPHGHSASTATSSTILALLRDELEAGAHADVFRLKGHVLNCAELDGAQTVAKGYLRAALASGDEALQHGGGGELDRLPRAVARRRGGVSGGIRVGVAPVSLGTGRLGVGSLRMLHTCFLPRSSADPSGGATSTRGSGSTSARARAGSRSGTHGDRSSPSTRRHFSHQSDNPESASRWLIGNRRAAPGPP